MKYITTTIILTVLLPFAAHAATPVIPGTGDLLQQTQPVKPVVPSSTEPGLEIQHKKTAPMPDSGAFLVKKIVLSGNTLFDTDTLHALVADAEGTQVTLPQLQALAARITEYYRQHNYVFARAFIPAQTMGDSVKIEIIEAYYGVIKLDNQSGVSDGLVNATLAPLHTGDAINQAKMDRALLLLSDIPGLSAHATLKPGEKVGQSDLQIGMTATPAVTGSLTLDNYGNHYIGRPRVGFSANLINPLHHGDIFTVNGSTSGDGMQYGRFAYDTLLNGQGTRVGAAYSALHYKLGEDLQALNAHGMAQVASAWVKHPLIRSRNLNLNGQIQFDHMDLRDQVDVAQQNTFRHLDGATATLSGDVRDSLLSGGLNIWKLDWTGGTVNFDDAAAQTADAATANTQGWYSIWNLNLARLQNLSKRNALYVSLTGQWSLKNLDSSKKMLTGGPYTVRAYDTGALAGDSGYIGTVELRHDLNFTQLGHLQTVVFFDSAQVTINQNTWSNSINSATLSGAGVGLTWYAPRFDWTGSNQLSVQTYVAAPVGPTPSLVGKTNSVRGWMEMSLHF